MSLGSPLFPVGSNAQPSAEDEAAEVTFERSSSVVRAFEAAGSAAITGSESASIKTAKSMVVILFISSTSVLTEL